MLRQPRQEGARESKGRGALQTDYPPSIRGGDPGRRSCCSALAGPRNVSREEVGAGIHVPVAGAVSTPRFQPPLPPPTQPVRNN